MALGMFDPKCPQCGKPVSRQARFCGSCGAALSGGTIVCGVCAAENNANANFCRECGRPLAQSASPEVQRHHWARRDEDFAVRIEANDLPGTLQRGLVIEPGTNAILIEHGVNRGMVPPGKYVLENAGQKLWDWLTNGIPERATALLVDVTPTELLFNLGGRFTSDPLPIGVTVRVQVAVDEPAKFLINLLKGRERLSKDDLRQYLYPEVVQVVDRWLRQHTLQDLAEDAGQHEKLELTLEEALKTTFGQTGLRFLQIRAVELNLEPYDKVKGIRGKYALWTMETTAELEGRKGALSLSAEARRVEEDEQDRQRTEEADRQERREREGAARDERQAKEAVDRKARYAELQHQVDLLALADETRKVQMQEDRVQLYQRMRQAVSSDKMNDVRTEADFDRFLDEIDHEKLLREKERQDLERVWKEEGEDHDRARAHLLAKLDIEQQFEERGLRARLQHSADLQTIDNEIEISRKRADFDFETRRKNVDIEIDLERKRREIELEREKIEEERQERKRDLDRLTQQQKLEDERRARQQDREEDRADAVMGMELLAKMKENRLKDEESRLALQRLDEEERLRIHRVDELERSKLQQSLALERMEAEERLRQAARDHEFKVQQAKDEQALKTQQREQDYQLERMRLTADMGPEALISLSGPEQARILADLKKAEALKDMTEEQILAMAAEHSPAVAQALQEKFRAIAAGQTSQEVKDLYERLLKEREAAVETARQQQAENERLLREDADKRVRETSAAWEKATAQAKDTTERAIDRMADVAQAFARNPAQPPAPVIVNNPAGVPQVIHPGMGVGLAAHNPPGTELKTCPKCGHSVVAEERFCEHCGHAFEGMG